MVAGTGSVHLLTVLHIGPPAAGVDYAAGFPLVAVELDEQEGLRWAAQVVSIPPDDVRVGMPVELCWVDRDGTPVPAFRPRGAQPSGSDR